MSNFINGAFHCVTCHHNFQERVREWRRKLANATKRDVNKNFQPLPHPWTFLLESRFISNGDYVTMAASSVIVQWMYLPVNPPPQRKTGACHTLQPPRHVVSVWSVKTNEISGLLQETRPVSWDKNRSRSILALLRGAACVGMIGKAGIRAHSFLFCFFGIAWLWIWHAHIKPLNK